MALQPEWPFNIIYSSGTTGTPKGIVQSHGMRWTHVMRGAAYGYGPQTVTLLSTPLYSNTTLVVFLPSMAYGATVHLMAKFDAAGYLALAEKLRVTHTMLVPVQYQRIMALPDFDRHDLKSFHMKFCTSAPFNAALKADVLKRWPGGLVEFYGMTEGGGSCILNAHEHPDKLHTVGRPAEGHDIRLIDEQGHEVPPGEAGEVVGHSRGMMIGYHGQPQKTARGRVVRRQRQALHPHRRHRPLRCRRLPDPVRPAQGHGHQRRLQHLSQRPGRRAAPARRRWPTRPWSACRRSNGARRRWPTWCDSRAARWRQPNCCSGSTSRWARHSA